MIEVRIPLQKTVMPVTPNKKMHHMTAYLRNKKLKAVITRAFLADRKDLQAREMLRMTQSGLFIQICYVRPRMLDTDNLVACLKHARDVIAIILIPDKAAGQADGDIRLSWFCDQRQGIPREYLLEITIYER